jgi:D-glycero-alpha-D-manno-heptose-7-phosphate kinase
MVVMGETAGSELVTKLASPKQVRRRKPIIATTHMRITFVGGGTDLPEIYTKIGHGASVAATIDYWSSIIVNRREDHKIVLRYSDFKEYNSVSEIEHKPFRVALEHAGITSGIEIASTASLSYKEGGVGLASGSAFMASLLSALYSLQEKYMTLERLAEDTYYVERELMGTSCGKQDQYMVTHGGMMHMRFNSDESVQITPFTLNIEETIMLQNSLVLAYTGKRRSADQILKQQAADAKDHTDVEIKMRDLADEMLVRLRNREWDSIGTLMDKNWNLKKQLTDGISNPEFDRIYDSAKSNGAVGGKIIGAGGGGFWLFWVPPQKRKKLTDFLKDEGIAERPFQLVSEPSAVQG